MTTIGVWFNQNTKKPLIWLGSIIMLIQASFIYFNVVNSEAEQTLRIKNLVQRIAATAIEQNNRDIIEASFTVAVEELGAQRIFLCKGNRIYVSFPQTEGAQCQLSDQNSFSNRLVEMPASGYSDYRFLFLVPRWKLTTPFVALMLLTSVFILVFFSILIQMRRRLENDILRPLETKLFSDDIIDIKELDEIRTSIRRNSSVEIEKSAMQAKKESEAKFAHNIQSPLGKLNTLKDRLLTQVDTESAQLLDSVVTEISDMTFDYTKGSNLGEQTGNLYLTAQETALVEMRTLLDEAIKAKKLEISKRRFPIQIDFLNKIRSHTYVEANVIELRSIISNILNNAVESGANEVKVCAINKNGSVEIAIGDNGSGIPTDIENLIFEKNFTSGKPLGTGFGLYHARRFLELWGGSVKLASSSSKGSTFEILIPIFKTPEIKIRSSDQIVLIEDRAEIRNKFKKKYQPMVEKKIIEFADSSSALAWFESTDVPMSDVTVLADNDLGASSIEGVDLIEKLGISGSSYLITDSFGSSRLYSKCKDSGIRLLPKPLAMYDI